jgi:hypothetical protein
MSPNEWLCERIQWMHWHLGTATSRRCRYRVRSGHTTHATSFCTDRGTRPRGKPRSTEPLSCNRTPFTLVGYDHPMQRARRTMHRHQRDELRPLRRSCARTRIQSRQRRPARARLVRLPVSRRSRAPLGRADRRAGVSLVARVRPRGLPGRYDDFRSHQPTPQRLTPCVNQAVIAHQSCLAFAPFRLHGLGLTPDPRNS